MRQSLLVVDLIALVVPPLDLAVVGLLTPLSLACALSGLELVAVASGTSSGVAEELDLDPSSSAEGVDLVSSWSVLTLARWSST
jgi:hypothetical protein